MSNALKWICRVISSDRAVPRRIDAVQPIIADGASELLQDVFGKDKNPSRLVYGVASLPLGVPVELELIFEVSP